MSGIFGTKTKMAAPLSLGSLGLGAMEFCPSPCTAEPNADVKRYQSMMNVDLKRMNYSQLSVDGKLGRGTCGASMFFSQVPQLFNTARAGWDDNLAYLVYKACDGKPYALPAPLTKKDSVFVDDKDDPVCKKESPAWLAASMKVNVKGLNVQLADLGYEPINSADVINATTCGAMKLIDALNNTQYLCNPGFNCKEFTPPTKKQSPVAVATPVPVTPTPTPIVTSTPPTTKQASMATTGIIAGVLAIGVYALNKKYHWFG